MKASGREKEIAALETAANELKAKLAGLEVEQERAREKAEQAEASWRSALADQRLGEGGKAAVTKARAALDAAREDVLGVDGAVGEIGRRLTAAEADLLAARLAALSDRADKDAAELGRCVAGLLDLDAKAGIIRKRMEAVGEELLRVKGEHVELDLEHRSPGDLPNLPRILFEGLAESDSGLNQRGHMLLAHLELAGFFTTWRGGPAAPRMLGAGKEEVA